MKKNIKYRKEIAIFVLVVTLVLVNFSVKSHAGIFEKILNYPWRTMAKTWTLKNKNKVDFNITSINESRDNWSQGSLLINGQIENRTSKKITYAYIDVIVVNKETGLAVLTKEVNLTLNVYPSGNKIFREEIWPSDCKEIIESFRQLGNNASWTYKLLFFKHE